MSTVLIVNADDFALTEGISTGILEASESGIVSSTSVVMTADRAPIEIARARERMRPLSLAVHLNLTYGCPLSDPIAVRSLVDSQGVFTSLEWKRSHRDSLDPGHVKVEWQRQIERLGECGADLDHLDCHHFAAALTPTIWEVYLELGREYRCGVRPLPEAPTELAPVLQDERVIPEQLNALLTDAGLSCPDVFLTSFYGLHATRTQLLTLIENLPDGIVELMVHPGHHDDELARVSGYTHERQIIGALRTRGVTLTDYRGAGLT